MLYIDADMRIHRFPTILRNDKNADFMAYNWNKEAFETAGGIMYFNNTNNAKRLLTLWEKELQKHSRKADDRVLAMTVAKHDAHKWCSMKWLPDSYLHFPAFFPKLKYVVVSHPYASTDEEEAYLLGACRNRIPSNYKNTIRKWRQHNA